MKKIQFIESMQTNGSGIKSKFYYVRQHLNGCDYGKQAIRDMIEYDDMIPARHFGLLLFDLTTLGYTILPTWTESYYEI